MRYLLTLLILFTLSAGAQTTYYVSPTGNDANPGTIGSPFRNWAKLSTVMHAGDIAYIRGGIYTSTAGASNSVHCLFKDLIGNSTDSIKIYAYPGESPVFDLSSITPTNSDPTAVIIQNCRYVHFKGLRITGLKQIASGAGVSRGIDLRGSANNKFELIELDHIGGYGYILSDASNDNYFLNCDAHHMDDRLTTGGGAWGNANGFQCTGGSTATRNTFDGCRAWWISDDGFDLYSVNGTFTFKNCWAFWNGFEPGTFTKRGDGRGFKIGPHNTSQHSNQIRFFYRNIAFENATVGFDQNGGDLRVVMYNNTSFDNPEYGYMWDYISPAPSQDFKNNLSYQDGTVRRGTETNGTTNSWNMTGPVSGDFVSTSSAGADGPRQADGSLPDINFMKLTPGSKYVDAGTIVSGVLYSGSKPDVGAREYVAPIVTPTLTVSLTDTLRVTLPLDSVYISSTVSGGSTPYTYSYSFVSGTGVIRTPSSVNTWVKLSQGTFTIRLNVTDNAGTTVYDDVVIIVSPSPNTKPTSYIWKSISSSGGRINTSWWADVTSNTKSFTIQQKKSRVYSDVVTVAAKSGVKDYKTSFRGTSGTFRLKVTDKTGIQYSKDLTVGFNTSLTL